MFYSSWFFLQPQSKHLPKPLWTFKSPAHPILLLSLFKIPLFHPLPQNLLPAPLRQFIPFSIILHFRVYFLLLFSFKIEIVFRVIFFEIGFGSQRVGSVQNSFQFFLFKIRFCVLLFKIVQQNFDVNFLQNLLLRFEFVKINLNLLLNLGFRVFCPRL